MLNRDFDGNVRTLNVVNKDRLEFNPMLQHRTQTVGKIDDLMIDEGTFAAFNSTHRGQSSDADQLNTMPRARPVGGGDGASATVDPSLDDDFAAAFMAGEDDEPIEEIGELFADALGAFEEAEADGADDLPWGWTAHGVEGEEHPHGSTYYHHAASGETTWVHPKHTEGLGQGWEVIHDENGDVFYHNAATNETVWEKPEAYIRMPTVRVELKGRKIVV